MSDTRLPCFRVWRFPGFEMTLYVFASGTKRLVIASAGFIMVDVPIEGRFLAGPWASEPGRAFREIADLIYDGTYENFPQWDEIIRGQQELRERTDERS